MNHQWLILVTTAFAASTVAAIAGTGGGIILLPVLASVFGARDAVPIYAIAQLVGNLSRVAFNRPFIDYKVVGWFAIGAIPFAIIGSWLFTRLPDAGLPKLLGGFLILSSFARWLYPALQSGFKVQWFAPLGGIFASISATVGSAGPFIAPFYLSYGLTKGAFIGTEALGTALMHIAKLSAYHSLGAINAPMWTSGLLLGPVMIAGAYTGKRVLDRIPPQTFMVMIDCVVAGFGIWFLLK